MASDDRISNVTHVEEVDPNLLRGDRSTDINDFLSIDGWILLETGRHTGPGDNGSWASVYYSVGWVGEGEPEFPPVT